MNASIVLAVPQPRAEAPPPRMQKGVPDGFAQALADCKARQSAESDVVDNATETTTEDVSDVEVDTAAIATQLTPQAPVDVEAPQPADAPSSETRPSDDKTTELPSIAVFPSIVLPELMLAAPETAEPPASEPQTMVAAVFDEVSSPAVTSNAATELVSMPIGESLGSSSPVSAAATETIDVSVLLRTMLEAPSETPGTVSLAESVDSDDARPTAVAQMMNSASVTDVTTELAAIETNVARSDTDDTTKAVEPAGKNGTKASLTLAAAPHVVRSEESPPAAAGTERVSATMLQEVAVKGVRYLAGQQEKTLAVRLVPPSLGELHIEVSTASDGLHVRLLSANPVVRETLENHLQALRDTFATNNIDVKSISVLSGMAGQTAGHSFANPQFSDLTGHALPRTMATVLRPAAATETNVTMAYSPPHDGALNVLV